MARFGMVGQSYQSQTFSADSQMCMNMYVEKSESGSGKSDMQLVKCPGLSVFASISGSAGRGCIQINGRAFAVVDTIFYEIASDGTATNRGTVGNDGLPVSMTSSNQQVLIASAGLVYYFTLATNTFVALDPAVLTGVSIVGFTDSYFLALLKNSNSFQFSGLLDASSWDILDKVTISIFPGNIISMVVDHREIALLGDQKSVIYYDTGDATNPFLPVPSGIMETGCSAIYSGVRADNSVFWLGKDERGAGIAYKAQGYTPQRVSTFAIEFAWQSYSDITDCVTYSYQERGHIFVVFRFPTANKTWVYDASSNMWHERGFWTNGHYIAHRSMSHMYVFGKHLVCDWNSGNIYQMSSTLYDDFGNTMRWVRRSPYVASEGYYITIPYLEVEADTGIGLVSGQGSDPQLMMRWSNDNGKTWSNEWTQSIGALGQYGKRVFFRRLGRFWGTKGRIFELSGSDPVPYRITDAYIPPPTTRLADKLRSQA